MLLLALLAACHSKDTDTDRPEDTDVTDSGSDSVPVDSGTDSGTDSGADSGTDTGPPDTGTPVVITGGATVADNPDNRFSALVSVTVDHDGDLVVAYGEAALDHATPTYSVRAGITTTIPVLGLHSARTFTVQATVTSGAASWASEPLTYRSAAAPTDFPNCTVSTAADAPDYGSDEAFCTNSLHDDGTPFYWCADRQGRPIFEARTRANDTLMSMTPLPTGGWVSTSRTSSKVVLFDDASKETAEYTIDAFTPYTRFHHDIISNHEARPIASGKYAGDVIIITDNYEYLADGSYRIPDGIIVFNPDTRAVDYDYSLGGPNNDGVAMDPKLPYSRVGWGDYLEDWNHVNAVVPGADEDGREFFLLSSRSQDWILKLYPDDDSLAWVAGADGDFTLVDDLDASSPRPVSELQWQFHQHGLDWISTTDSRMRLFAYDNGNLRHDDDGTYYDRVYSRLMELVLDESTMQAQVAWSYGAPSSSSPDYFYSYACGNAYLSPTGDSVFGAIGTSGILEEVSYPAGELRWRLTCDDVDFCAYRSRYYPTLYDTSWIYE